MPQVKIGVFKFGEDKFKLRYVVGNDKDVLFVAKDIASVLKYEKPANAVAKHVDKKYKCYFLEKGPRIEDPSFGDNGSVGVEVSIIKKDLIKKGHPLFLYDQTILITKSGVIQLIMKSKLPYAVELQEWLLEEVIPQVLCTGKYQPAVANNSECLSKSNEMILKMSQELILAKQNSDAMIQEMIVARRDAETARRDMVVLSTRIADIAQDVITKPSNPQLLHTLAVCEIGNNEFAFLRPQKRSLQRSLNNLRRNGQADLVYANDYVPNSMNVLNKVKEHVPKDKFKAKNNKITLLKEYDKQKLIEIINKSLTARQLSLVQQKLSE
ncbi:BRO-A [Agrotis segetum nucleopolyhedrovirus A]|uniref:BRO-A n=1 Tax=Agrotis segetum nuclear polyhedrosis virus TaxID=1962501 RepID=Q287M2_NPVAS|nr:BRO-A [Agrotis segetum nucleopolyhedrovirus A]AAZ38216.1 BRO-A [Agrotis segetum nucleopolyhedrovirus A]